MIWRLFTLGGSAWRVMVPAALFGCLTIGSNIGLMATSALLISGAALHPSVSELAVAIVGVRFFGLSRALFRYLERYLSHDATFQLLSAIRVWFYTALEPLAPGELQKFRSGDLFSALSNDVETLKEFYLRAMAPPVIAVLTLGGMVAFLAPFGVEFVTVLVVAFLMIGIGLPFVARYLHRDHGGKLVAARAELQALLVDSIAGMAELSAFCQTRRQAERLAALNRQLLGYQKLAAGRSGLMEALGNFIMNSAVWCVLYLAIPLVHSGQLAGVYLAVLALAVQSSFEAVVVLPLAAQYLAESMAAARRLFAIADLPISQPETVQSNTLPYELKIEAANLSFRYTGQSEPAVADISFSLPEGGCLAIVGSSGAGKSTLFQLLLRFWDYSEGSLQLGGREFSSYSTATIRNLLGVVPQQSHLFNASIRENILLARPTASAAELSEAVQQAALDKFISALPQGYDTFVGQNGQALSGGQRQRVALARALLKKAPILLLDEPTIGLDSVTEREVMQTIAELMSGRTTILITHRLTGLETMDEILVMDSGRIIERGRQAELLAQKGWYYRMYHLQRDILR
ncbi:MAG TPA: thiol reductant ABC exporter subunit CydC [Negativicutes bacterium]